ncbi:MAG: type I methionyl aminopeptidase [Bacteroidales bacterium]|jgi:methionyl aminopeptidase|nr:type I methionyl aminopeptidase [Bacteroidales bacterium]MBQ1905171.1 type I methionyl aminopeptidase [Bacteroidales bacterium]MBQ2104536.1 type I methionyl aminopeptidase [Bacteroidales bacterium]MBQ2500869.1 type I methionyl aminopeptidase [Bacteroidales bacterium]MBQ3975992.1 type I methionyl aminopeptidase [Bacteroidales bacterium]
MVEPKTEEEIALLRENAILVSKTLAEVGKAVAPGVTTKELNRVAETFIRDNGAVPSFLGFEGFPAAICTSVNDVVVHGFPSDYVLKEGDIVTADIGTLYKGYNGDSAYTFPVGEIDANTRKLLDVTKASLYKGIEAAVEGNRVGDIGHAVQTYVESFGFSVVRELEGHGIGKGMHENPGVPNFGKRGKGAKLINGMTICIEPMVNAGNKSVYLDRNGWAVHTSDRRNSAHYELTVVVRKGHAEQLSTFDYIEKDGKIKF